ncbi:MAG TPA: type II toxin-antitoxin system VapC family toxin [Caulobacteraceae bacterium]
MRVVIDASVALKWVMSEVGSEQAAALQGAASLMAPDLIVREWCAALSEKVRRREMSVDDALLAARILQHVDIELRPMRSLLLDATRLALVLQHPADECFYLALAFSEGCPLVTADGGMAARLAASPAVRLPRVLSLADAAQALARA